LFYLLFLVYIMLRMFRLFPPPPLTLLKISGVNMQVILA
jgi:hypothetical protein